MLGLNSSFDTLDASIHNQLSIIRGKVLSEQAQLTHTLPFFFDIEGVKLRVEMPNFEGEICVKSTGQEVSHSTECPSASACSGAGLAMFCMNTELAISNSVKTT